MPRTIDDRVLNVLRRVGLTLNIVIDSSQLDLADVASCEGPDEELELLRSGAKRAGIFVKETVLELRDIESVLDHGLSVIAASPNGTYTVFEKRVGSKLEVCHINAETRFELMSRSDLQRLLNGKLRLFVAKKELECNSASQSHASGPEGHQHSGHAHSGHQHAGHGSHLKPLRRFLILLRFDMRDVNIIAVFALVAGILALATPLAIESLVNVVSWGTFIQPLVVLGVMLLACLGFAGVLRILQTIVVEMIQRRHAVRIVGDLAHRFPRAQQAALADRYPRELANRLFDIVTIQKASAVLLLDGISLAMSTVLGLLLLAFYHPFLLGFDIILLSCMVLVTWALGRGGILTAIDESIVKYQIAHWLQDVIASPTPFKINGGEMLAVERANRLTSEYIMRRQRQFRVVIRQVVFAIGLQVIASTALLGLGGWLVMRQQLTLGQLVASELVITVVLGAFAKAGKSLEQFFDLMAGTDKVGHLLDIPVDPRYELGEVPAGPVEVRWEDLSFHEAGTGLTYHIPPARFEAGSRVTIYGNDRSGKSLLIRCLAGMETAEHGIIEVGGFEAQRAVLAGQGRMVGYAGPVEIFNGTVHDNVDLGRADVGHNRVRDVLVQVGLWDDILRLPQGLNTMLQTSGVPLAKSQRHLLMIAQAMAGKPRLLLLDEILDGLSEETVDHLWPALAGPEAPWTLLVSTNQRSIAQRCTTHLNLEHH